jgi:riboflavin kinase/FMN adenylyltransferase
VQISLSLANILTPTAIALGNFDGVHRGHLEVIKPILNWTASDVYKTVVTFDPHPQEFFSGQTRQLLTPRSEKAAIFQELGIEQMILLPFDRDLVELSPQEFVSEILDRKLQAKFVSVGADFCFGKQRSGNAKNLEEIAAQYQIQSHIASLALNGESRISSSGIRAALLAGDLQVASNLLGRNYMIVGQVVQGQQIGRSIGFPTANLAYPPEKFLPRQGVYCVWVDTPDQKQLRGVMNIGKRPTVGGLNTTVEVHLLDWHGDLYGQELRIHLLQFLRSEQKFPSLEALTHQIQKDCDRAKDFFARSANIAAVGSQE